MSINNLSKNNTFNSQWVNTSSLGILGPRSRVAITIDQNDEIHHITLIAQSTLGRLFSSLEKVFNIKTQYGSTLVPLPVHFKTLEIWNTAKQHLSLDACRHILFHDLETVISKSPTEISNALNQTAVQTLKNSLDSWSSLQYIIKTFSDNLEHFYTSTVDDWNCFAQGKLSDPKSSSRITSITVEVLAKQKKIIQKCKNQCSTTIADHLNIFPSDTAQTDQFLSWRFNKFYNLSDSFDFLLNRLKKNWESTQEAIDTADSIQTLDHLMDQIIDGQIVEETLFDILNEKCSDGFEACFESVQVKVKDLLLALSPNNATFQSFHSPRALSSAFLMAQIASYQTPEFLPKLSRRQKDILEEINVLIKCIEHFEGAENATIEKEKTLAVAKLYSVKNHLAASERALLNYLKQLIPSQYSRLGDAEHDALNVLQDTQLHISKVLNPNLKWSKISLREIAIWISNAENVMGSIQQIIAESPEEARTIPADSFDLTAKIKDPLQKVLLDSFLENLSQIQQNHMEEISRAKQPNVNQSEAIATSTTANKLLIESIQEHFTSSPETTLLSLFNHLFSLLTESSPKDLSLDRLTQYCLYLARTKEQNPENIENAKDIKFNIFVLHFLLVTTLETIKTHQQLFKFIADDLEISKSPLLKSNYLNSIQEIRKLLNEIPKIPNFRQIPLVTIQKSINSSLQKFHTANPHIESLINL